MTFRDDSASRTLDNANEGIMELTDKQMIQGLRKGQESLVEMIQEQEAEIDALKADVKRLRASGLRFIEEHSERTKEAIDLLDKNQKLKAENERLLPYVDAFRREEGRADKLDRKVDDLNAENERLRKDAKRYRWLRDPCVDIRPIVKYQRGDYGWGLWTHQALDEAIDAAMKDFSTTK